MFIPELIIPLLGGAVAVLSSVVKDWVVRKSKSEIVINLGNGSKITLDGSEESRERIRKVLAESFGSLGQSDIVAPPVQQTSETPEVKKDQQEGHK